MSNVGCLCFSLSTELSPTQAARGKKALTLGKPPYSVPHFPTMLQKMAHQPQFLLLYPPFIFFIVVKYT